MSSMNKVCGTFVGAPLTWAVLVHRYVASITGPVFLKGHFKKCCFFSSLVSLPKLVDFDWRVDVKTSSDTISRMSMPTCIVQLQVLY